MRKTLSALLLVVLVSCGQAALKPASTGPSPKPFDPPTSWALFLTGDQSMQQSYSRTPLDAATLKDMGAAVAGRGYATASADGSTLAEIDYKPDATSSISITDTRTRALRTAFESSIASGPALTPDGTRLLAFDSSGRSYRVFDTRSGRVTGSLETSDTPCCNIFSVWLDPTGAYLYGILVPGSGYNASGPVTPELVRYDLHAGRENARLRLTGVLAGVWRTGKTAGSEQETTILQPGAALSPDGSQLAVLYADGSRLMTIDPIRMKITATRPVSVPSAPTSWSGWGPIEVDAKAQVGTIWSLDYSPDGRHLIAGEHELTIDPTSQVSTSRGLGVRVIDVATATITADRRGLDLGQIAYAPDSTALFATSWSDGKDGQRRTVVLRLDPSNLATAAQREFIGYRWLLLLAH